MAFATASGAGLWVTFIGGIVMFRYLPRHQFGSLHGKMSVFHADISKFRYICGSIRIPAPLEDSNNQRYQLGFLLPALGCNCNLSNLLVFTPMIVEMMKKHKMQKDLGIGTEVGYSNNAETVKRSPALAVMMNYKFGMIHGLSSLANILSFGSLAMHS